MIDERSSRLAFQRCDFAHNRNFLRYARFNKKADPFQSQNVFIFTNIQFHTKRKLFYVFLSTLAVLKR